MQKRENLQLVVVLVWLMFLSALCTVPSASATYSVRSMKDGVILYVGGSGPGNYSTIQAAVDNASDGDTVFVYDDSSPYWENIAINVSLRLIGENRNTTSIEGGSHAVTLYADGITVSGFTIRNVGDFWNCCGFHVLSDDNNISGNTIADNLRMNGIFIDCGSYNKIYGNRIQNNNYHGIRLEYSTHNIIENNIIANNRGYGMYLWESTDNRLLGNTVQQSYWTGLMMGDNCRNNTLFHNNLIDNRENAYDETGNTWDNGSRGNYWSDYTGSDDNSDGIGDVPYWIPGNTSRDACPLMQPYGTQKPILTISITGGFGVTVTVKNTGIVEATQVAWSIRYQGGILLLPVDRCHQGTIDLLAAGEETAIQASGVLCGVGWMTVNVIAQNITAARQGFVVLFFFIPSLSTIR